MADDQWYGDVPPSLVAFLTFLDDRGLLEGEPLPTLVGTVEELLPAFETALDDPVSWGMGKRLMTSMGGLDAPDPDALEEMMERFNALPFEERDAILSGTGALPPVIWSGGPVRADVGIRALFRPAIE